MYVTYNKIGKCIILSALLISINFTYIYHKLQKELILNDNNWIIYTYYDYKNKGELHT